MTSLLRSSSSSRRRRTSREQVRYRGLFSPESAPTTRATCLLLGLLLGSLMLTAGSVFCHVHLSRPRSGSRPMRTPPMPLALGLVLAGLATLLAAAAVAYRLGCDDGDEDLEDDLHVLGRDDDYENDHQHDDSVQRPV